MLHKDSKTELAGKKQVENEECKSLIPRVLTDFYPIESYGIHRSSVLLLLVKDPYWVVFFHPVEGAVARLEGHCLVSSLSSIKGLVKTFEIGCFSFVFQKWFFPPETQV